MEAAIEYKVQWQKEIDRRKRLGIIGLPEPLPHPDDIVIDMKSGLVHVKGPMTAEEQANWQILRDRKAECNRAIAELEQELRDNPKAKYKPQLLAEIEDERNIRNMICRVIPD